LPRCVGCMLAAAPRPPYPGRWRRLPRCVAGGAARLGRRRLPARRVTVLSCLLHGARVRLLAAALGRLLAATARHEPPARQARRGRDALRPPRLTTGSASRFIFFTATTSLFIGMQMAR